MTASWARYPESGLRQPLDTILDRAHPRWPQLVHDARCTLVRQIDEHVDVKVPAGMRENRQLDILHRSPPGPRGGTRVSTSPPSRESDSFSSVVAGTKTRACGTRPRPAVRNFLGTHQSAASLRANPVPSSHPVPVSLRMRKKREELAREKEREYWDPLRQVSKGHLRAPILSSSFHPGSTGRTRPHAYGCDGGFPQDVDGRPWISSGRDEIQRPPFRGFVRRWRTTRSRHSTGFDIFVLHTLGCAEFRVKSCPCRGMERH